METTRNISALQTHYTDIRRDLGLLVETMQDIDRVLKDVYGVLNITRKADEVLTLLSDILEAISIILAALAPVPFVGQALQAVKAVIDPARQIVSKVQSQVNKLEQKIRPHREKIAEKRKLITANKSRAAALGVYLQAEEKHFGEAVAATGGMDGFFKTYELRRLDGYGEKIISCLRDPETLIQALNADFNDMSEALAGVRKLCDALAQPIRPIIELCDDMNDTEESLKQLESALDQKLGPMSIREILFVAQFNPMTRPLMEAAKQILVPLIKSVMGGRGGVDVSSTRGVAGPMQGVLGGLVSVDNTLKKSDQRFGLLFGPKNPEAAIEKIFQA